MERNYYLFILCLILITYIIYNLYFSNIKSKKDLNLVLINDFVFYLFIVISISLFYNMCNKEKYINQLK